MKINITFDMTPEEFRRVLGLPDVAEFQRELFDQMLKRMHSGEDGYDPMSLYQPMMQEGMNTMNQMQKMMFSMMSGSKGGDKNE
ncbi:hypothetical protein GCM10011297_01190 [Bacterioplanes sanyensis]|uniref:DUF6489 family protein n=1 Tax=Bacterioplanes sanyensis TaxID=1249553 RepID=UPI001674E8E7|nr:DUF6489 family protein [Bacterioplanes sanyensis]GGY32123.1 hypothetical protein GCM10011297_01190 [Bacterioplanes sanyensis]